MVVELRQLVQWSHEFFFPTNPRWLVAGSLQSADLETGLLVLVELRQLVELSRAQGLEPAAGLAFASLRRRFFCKQDSR